MIGENYTSYNPTEVKKINITNSLYIHSQPYYRNNIIDLMMYADSLGIFVSVGGNLLGGSGSLKRSYP